MTGKKAKSWLWKISRSALLLKPKSAKPDYLFSFETEISLDQIVANAEILGFGGLARLQWHEMFSRIPRFKWHELLTRQSDRCELRLDFCGSLETGFLIERTLCDGDETVAHSWGLRLAILGLMMTFYVKVPLWRIK
jgi:hypothetical protein